MGSGCCGLVKTLKYSISIGIKVTIFGDLFVFVNGENYFRFDLACDKAEAATDFEALPYLPSVKILDAVEATLGLVTFLLLDFAMYFHRLSSLILDYKVHKINILYENLFCKYYILNN